jgi:hypothetical protein
MKQIYIRSARLQGPRQRRARLPSRRRPAAELAGKAKLGARLPSFGQPPARRSGIDRAECRVCAGLWIGWRLRPAGCGGASAQGGACPSAGARGDIAVACPRRRVDGPPQPGRGQRHRARRLRRHGQWFDCDGHRTCCPDSQRRAGSGPPRRGCGRGRRICAPPVQPEPGRRSGGYSSRGNCRRTTRRRRDRSTLVARGLLALFDRLRR